jgi:MSHA biogenesis protein MshM
LPEETLDALCTLYDLQSSYHKLFQIVLFGEPRLDERLASPSMGKIKARVAHHFMLQPFTAKVVEAYLSWRLGAVDYRGNEMFSRPAIRSITMASCGHIQQLDLFAANSLRIAYAAQSQVVDASHAKEAIRGVGIKPGFNWRSWRLAQDLPNRHIASMDTLLSVTPVVAVALLSWSIWQSPAISNSAPIAAVPLEVSPSAPLLVPVPSSTNPATVAGIISSAPPSAAAAVASSNAPSAVVPSSAPAEPKAPVPVPPVPHNSPDPAVQRSSTASIGGVKLVGYELLEQRVDATIKTVSATNRDTYTIQLFATENVQPDRMERFLARARSMIDISDVYVHPVINGDRAKFRVTYGIYSSREQASAALGGLPEKYQSSFQPEIYALSEIN